MKLKIKCDTKEKEIMEASWLIRNFVYSLQNNYSENSPRMVEAKNLSEKLFKQIKKQTPKHLKDMAEKYCKL